MNCVDPFGLEGYMNWQNLGRTFKQTGQYLASSEAKQAYWNTLGAVLGAHVATLTMAEGAATVAATGWAGAAGIESKGTLSTTKVYRVWGGDPKRPDIPYSGPWGRSWTTVDPSTVSNYRNAAGLPSGTASNSINTGRFISEGYLVELEGVTARKAMPLDGNIGGLNEIIIPNPEIQVRLTNVSGVNPNY